MAVVELMLSFGRLLLVVLVVVWSFALAVIGALFVRLWLNDRVLADAGGESRSSARGVCRDR